MPRLLLAAALLALCSVAAHAQDDPEYVKARRGKFTVEENNYFTDLIYDGTLIGRQINERYLVKADAPIAFCIGTQWEALATIGMLGRWDPTTEPLTYYHRTGPVGAMFHHLRTRKGGADATAPVGVCGLYAGTPAAYARRGQSMTFYSVHDEPRTLIAETGRYFSYIPDARKRGAKVDFKYGPLRKTLAADADSRFALLLVEMVEEGFDPHDRLTLEAVKLYCDRTRPDGIVAFHASNKQYDLEPVVERIARELRLAARVWWDDSGGIPGKDSSKWIVLARTEADLGVLARPLPDQIIAYGTRNEPLATLVGKYRPQKPAREAVEEEWGIPTAGPAALTPTQVSIRLGPQVAILYQYIERARAADIDVSVSRLAEYVYGPMFHRLTADATVELRTDADRPGLPIIPPNPPPAKK